MTPRRRIGAAALALVLLAGAACTGDDGDDDRSVPTTEGASTTTEAEAEAAAEPEAEPEEPTTTVDRGDGPAPTAPGLDAPTVADGPIGGSRFVARVEPDPDPEGGGRLIVEDRQTGTERVVADRAGATPGAPQVSADGQLVVWDESSDDSETTSLVIRSGTMLEVRADAADIGCPRLLPDGRILASTFHDGRTRIALVDPIDGTVEELPGDIDNPGCMAPAGPDAVIAPVVRGEPFGPGGVDLVRFPLDDEVDGDIVGHLPGGCSTNSITTDRTAERAAVSLYCEDTSRNAIWVVDLVTGDARPIVAENNVDADFTTSAQYWDPVWSADGTTIAYQRSDPTAADGRNLSHIWLVDVASGATALLAEQPAFAPGLSPAG